MSRDPSGAGMTTAMLVILFLALPFLPVVALFVFAVRSVEYVPRAIHWVGRKRRKRWAQ